MLETRRVTSRGWGRGVCSVVLPSFVSHALCYRGRPGGPFCFAETARARTRCGKRRRRLLIGHHRPPQVGRRCSCARRLKSRKQLLGHQHHPGRGPASAAHRWADDHAQLLLTAASQQLRRGLQGPRLQAMPSKSRATRLRRWFQSSTFRSDLSRSGRLRRLL